MQQKEELIVVPIKAYAKELLAPFITQFTDSGGIYDNINSGILQEPLMPKFLSILVGYEVIKNFGPIEHGSDYYYYDPIIRRIEHKSAVLYNTNTAELTGVSDIKRSSDFISFYVRRYYMLYLVPTCVVLDICELRDAGIDKRLGFHADMVVDNKNNKLSNNTRILAKYARAINIETLKIYENFNKVSKLF